MIYEEFMVSAALVHSVLVSVFAGVFFAMGARWLDNHLLTFYPEVGDDAIMGEEEARLRGELSHLRLVWPKKEELKKAA